MSVNASAITTTADGAMALLTPCRSRRTPSISFWAMMVSSHRRSTPKALATTVVVYALKLFHNSGIYYPPASVGDSCPDR